MPFRNGALFAEEWCAGPVAAFFRSLVLSLLSVISLRNTCYQPMDHGSPTTDSLFNLTYLTHLTHLTTLSFRTFTVGQPLSHPPPYTSLQN
jgi:hypothetical protein